MPWRGPDDDNAWPTLGYDVGEWIEAHLVVPDGYLRGQPFLLTDEMWRFLIHFYRLYPHAEPWPAPEGLYYSGGQLRRPQKWGKDPFGAAIIWAEALGPTRFDGWNADGDPVGAPYPTPLIVCLGTSEEQTANTYRPLKDQARLGPLINMTGLDVGDTRVKLPGGGLIEPVTTSARARLGAPLTFLTITESHLFTQQGGFRKTAGAVKRNVAGMDGRWLELTNAWDPSEGSEAQVTGDDPDPRTYVDFKETHRVADLNDDEALYAELLHKYGDSAREAGGWVNIKGRIFHDARSTKHLEADRRRFFLDEIVVGSGALVDPVTWDLAAFDDELKPKDLITLGFDGSRSQDSTALIAARLKDGRLFQLGVWAKPANAQEWKVPRAQVDARVREVFKKFRVELMYCDPFQWQDHLDTWSAAFGEKIVVEFATNVEMRMDKAVERMVTALNEGMMTHDGSAVLSDHMKNAVVIKGSKKKPRPGEEDQLDQHYLKLAKKSRSHLIDAAVAAVLAYHARGVAIENGSLAKLRGPATSSSVPESKSGPQQNMLRPTGRLKI